MLANIDENRPAKYVQFAIKQQRLINRISCSPEVFCLSNPETNTRKLYDIVGDNLRAYQYCNRSDDKPINCPIVRYNILGAPGQGFQNTYNEYSKQLQDIQKEVKALDFQVREATEFARCKETAKEISDAIMEKEKKHYSTEVLEKHYVATKDKPMVLKNKYLKIWEDYHIEFNAYDKEKDDPHQMKLTSEF